MNELEQDLKRALRRKEPSPGLRSRCVAPRPASVRYWRWLGAVAAAALLMLGLTAEYQSFRQRQAARDAEKAIAVLSEKLNRTRLHLSRFPESKEHP